MSIGLHATALGYAMTLALLLVLAYRAYRHPHHDDGRWLGPICLVFAMNVVRIVWAYIDVVFLGEEQHLEFLYSRPLTLLLVWTAALILALAVASNVRKEDSIRA